MNYTANRHIVGVDGGGTGCRAVIADRSGNILGRGIGPSANIATDLEGAHRSILTASHAAYADAGLDGARSGSDVAVLGLAGSNISNFASQLEHSLPFFRSKVVNDRDTTVQGALGDADGSVAVIGTGSFFVGRHGDRLVSIGGWGFQVGDDGSGARIGQELLRRVVLAHDEVQPHSALTREILAEFGGSPVGVTEFALGAKPSDYGAFAPRIVAAARKEDVTATSILSDAISIVQHAMDTVGVADGGPLCLLGGLGPTYQELLDPSYQKLCTPPKGNALDGAVALALRIFAADLEEDA